MKNRNIYIVLLLGVALFCSCKSSKDDEGNSKTEYEKCNEWIAGVMRSDYLWKSNIPADNKLDYTASPETFFYTLLSDKDGKHTSSKNYYYSYIETNKDYTSSKTINDDTNSYGVSFVRYSIVDKSGAAQDYEYDRVMYVLSGSPAQTAGLSRGDWILKVDGSDINIKNADYKKLMSGASRTLTVLHKYSDAHTASITLPASTAVDNDPVFYSSVIDVNGKKVGYLVYNQFASGPHDNYKDHTYDNELITLFNSKFKNVDEFILDLRYNPGGYLSCARLLSRLLVPESSKSELFCKLTDANGDITKYNFKDVDNNSDYPLGGFTSLNLQRLFVIMTGSTASASEATFNGLTPYMNIIKVGLTSEGKNVGSVNYDGDDKYAWDIQPITFYITSAADNDYSAGITPDNQKNELNDEDNPNFLALGDENEYLLKTALNIIGGNAQGNKALKSQNIVGTNNTELIPIGIVNPSKTKGLIKTTD
ncbi:MAG: peptidase S41 [Bacteroidales bacterium]|nr:peptidase S41 [Bacteroidales bacterium]